MMGLMSLKEQKEYRLLCLTFDGITSRQLTANQKEGPHLTMLVP